MSDKYDRSKALSILTRAATAGPDKRRAAINELFHELHDTLKEAGWDVAMGESGGFPSVQVSKEKTTKGPAHGEVKTVKFIFQVVQTEFHEVGITDNLSRKHFRDNLVYNPLNDSMMDLYRETDGLTILVDALNTLTA